MSVYYEPNENTHPHKKPGLYERTEVLQMESERKEAVKVAAAGVVAESERLEKEAERAKAAERKRLADQANADKEAALKDQARRAYVGTDAEFNRVWRGGLREKVLGEAAVQGAADYAARMKKEAAAFVRGRF